MTAGPGSGAGTRPKRPRGAHNDPVCGGSFRPVHNSGDSAGPDAVVCPLCGAWRFFELFSGERDADPEGGDN